MSNAYRTYRITLKQCKQHLSLSEERTSLKFGCSAVAADKKVGASHLLKEPPACLNMLNMGRMQKKFNIDNMLIR